MIVVVGSSNTDLVIKVKDLPKAGQTVLGADYAMVQGGKGANQAAACAKLGHKVTFVACIGKDYFGDLAMASLIKVGVDTRFVVRDKKHPGGLALIMVGESGQNMIAVSPGSNSQLKIKDVTRAEKAIAKAQALLLQLEIPLPIVERAVAIAHKSGTRIVLNPAPAAHLSSALLSKIDILTPNETEAELLTGIKIRDKNDLVKTGNILLKQGVGCVIITLGEKGAYIIDRSIKQLIPAQKVKAVDTTCAGDAFSAALTVALSEGRSVIEAARFANKVAAYCIRKMGAQPSLPTRREVERW